MNSDDLHEEILDICRKYKGSVHVFDIVEAVEAAAAVIHNKADEGEWSMS